MAEDFAQAAHRVMMEATGRKPKTKPPAPTERDDDEGQPPDVQPISEEGGRPRRDLNQGGQGEPAV